VQDLLEGVDAPPESIDSDHIGLPTAGGAVSWSSSDSSVIAEDGRVTQPEQGADPVEVTLTATASIRGITETSEHVVTVVPSRDSAEARAEAAAEQYAVPAVLADGEPLPSAPEGVSVTPTGATGAALDDGAPTLKAEEAAAEQYVVPAVLGDGEPLPSAPEGVSVTPTGATGAHLDEGALTLETEEAADATVTVEIAREDAPETTVAKTFEVTVLPQDASTDLAAYHRTPTSEQEANNADVAYSMHLALAEEDGWQPLNENYG